MHATQPPTPFCARKTVTEAWTYCGRQWKVEARSSATCSCLCFLLSLLQKGRCSACTQKFKPIVPHKEKLLWGFMPSVHTSNPVFEYTQWLLPDLMSLERKIYSFKCIPGRGALSLCVTQGVSSPRLIVWSLPTIFSPTFYLQTLYPESWTLEQRPSSLAT